MRTGIFYGSTTGNTEKIALLLHKQISDSVLINISSASVQEIEKYTNILLGSSTWGYGELQQDWEDNIDILRKVNFAGKKVAFFGTGDQNAYPDTFGDAIGILYEIVSSRGANCIGSFSAQGYTFSDSKAIESGSFFGLLIDEDCQPELSEQRIQKWLNDIMPQLV